MKKPIYYIVNAITYYRLLAAPVLMFFVVIGQIDIFKWLLLLSFLTDAMDGYLARKYKVASMQGTRLDSIADEFTVIVAITGLFVLRTEFIRAQYPILVPVLVLYAVQTVIAVARYGRISSFHTYLAKAAAVMQALFLILAFFFEPIVPLFYAAAAFTALELVEEIVLVVILPRWKANVKGLYWVLKKGISRTW